MEDLKVTRANSAPYVTEQLNNIHEVCENYGLYADMISYKTGTSAVGAGFYVVISTEPISEDIKPYKLCDRIKRNISLFYPKDFAVKITNENAVVAFNAIMDFCEKSEFLRTLYKEYDASLPDCIRLSEYHGLKSLNEGRYNEDMGSEYQFKCAKGLREFFDKEKKDSKTFQEKRNFWRSNRYDEKASAIQRMKDFSKRDEPVVRFDVLKQYSNDINKICIGEDVYIKLVKYLKDCYPEVTIAVDEKEVYEDGMLDLADNLPSNHPMLKQKPITSAEYNEIMRKNFSEEGWKCVENFRASKWELRNVYYKEVDEPQFIAALNDICFEFADAEPMCTLIERGSCSIVDISFDELYQFVALAKQNNVLFHIDNRGKFAPPSLDDVHIVYNTRDQEKMDQILSHVVANSIMNSHVIHEEQAKHAPALNSKIIKAKEILAAQKLDETEKERVNAKNDMSIDSEI